MLSASLWGCGENLHPLAPGKMFELEFQRGHASKTIAYDNVTVTAQITPDKNDPSVQTVRVVIQAPGFDPYVAKLEQSPAGSNYTFGIGPLSAKDPVASVIL